jgi:hypothetical protein
VSFLEVIAGSHVPEFLLQELVPEFLKMIFISGTHVPEIRVPETFQ